MHKHIHIDQPLAWGRCRKLCFWRVPFPARGLVLAGAVALGAWGANAQAVDVVTQVTGVTTKYRWSSSHGTVGMWVIEDFATPIVTVYSGESCNLASLNYIKQLQKYRDTVQGTHVGWNNVDITYSSSTALVRDSVREVFNYGSARETETNE